MTISRRMRRLGAPSAICCNISQLNVRETYSSPIKCRRGVKQQIRCRRFSLTVLLAVLALLNLTVGYELDRYTNVSCMAFADDLISIFSSLEGQQDNLNILDYRRAWRQLDLTWTGPKIRHCEFKLMGTPRYGSSTKTLEQNWTTYQ